MTIVKHAEHPATYRRASLVGRVLGPNPRGQWFVVTEASYDSETDTTYATAELLRELLEHQ